MKTRLPPISVQRKGGTMTVDVIKIATFEIPTVTEPQTFARGLANNPMELVRATAQRIQIAQEVHL